MLTATAVAPSSLGLFRWIVGLFQLLAFAPHYEWLDDVPHGFFDPPEFSIAYIVGRFPPSPFFTVLDIVALLALIAMTVGWYTRAATLTLVVARLVGSSFVYSFGKIDHTELMLTAVLLALAFSSWGEHYTLPGALRRSHASNDNLDHDTSHRRPSRPLAIFATVLAFGLLTSAIPKARVWVDFDLSTSGVLSWYYPNRFSLGRDQFLASLVPGTPRLLLEITDYVAVLVELTAFAFLLLGRRAWLGYLAVLTAFHLANVLLLNIPFSGQVVTYVAFAGLMLPATIDARKPVLIGAAVAIAAGAWHVARRLAGGGALTVLAGDRPAQFDYLLYVSMGVCVVALAAMSVAFVRSR